MHRTQIQLDERQLSRFRQLANQRGVSLAQVIREALDEVLEGRLIRDAREVRQKAIAAAGRFRSGRRDVAERHDEYLTEAFGS
ncbi:MAG: ribbon-helix-helix protein, CopG family [Nitrospirae bacterium]|nr:ribbon-helix-helix protein, CopG family [Nitrospirota bacterium]